MNDERTQQDALVEDAAERLLKKILYLKKYEQPDEARMHRLQQNVMRRVREVKQNERGNLLELLHVRIPWFFAEPRYGIALLFVIFAGLQMLETMNRKPSSKESEVFTIEQTGVVYQPVETSATNQFVYPVLPEKFHLFPDVRPNDGPAHFVSLQIDPTE